jgi:hypothetical protein
MDDIPIPAGTNHASVVIVGLKAYVCGGYVIRPSSLLFILLSACACMNQ